MKLSYPKFPPSSPGRERLGGIGTHPSKETAEDPNVRLGRCSSMVEHLPSMHKTSEFGSPELKKILGLLVIECVSISLAILKIFHILRRIKWAN